MNVEYIIKELTQEDLNLDKEGFLETLRNLSETQELDYERLEQLLIKTKNQEGRIYIAMTSDKKIIGTAKLLIEQKFSHDGGKVGHVEDVVTRREYADNGIASNLMETLVNLARKEGCYKAILDCKDELVPFYNKFGFYHRENCLRLNLI